MTENRGEHALPDMFDTVITHLHQEVRHALAGIPGVDGDALALAIAARLVESVAYDGGHRWTATNRGKLVELSARLLGLAEMDMCDCVRPIRSNDDRVLN